MHKPPESHACNARVPYYSLSLSLQGVRVSLGRQFDQPNTSHMLQKIPI